MQTVAAPLLAKDITAKKSYRIDAIDLLRGLVMIIMALDHTRDFFHSEALLNDPLNLATTTPALFLTRFITHFCAPVFVFLAGTSAFFQSLRKSKSQLSGFLIKRGLWLIFVELFIISFSVTFDVSYSFVVLQTIWAIGASMIILGLVLYLPFAAILTLGLLIVMGHNVLDFYEAGKANKFSLFYQFMHVQGLFKISDAHTVVIMYPLLPWAGLMMLGFSFGKIYQMFNENERRKALTYMGVSIIALFIILRAINVYGDPEPWSAQKDSLFSFLSFINVHKYPPSLLFMAVTIGPALLFLAWVGDTKTTLGKIITVYGRVPFFYYVIHFFLLHILTTIFFFGKGYTITDGLKAAPFKFTFPPGDGFSLWVVYAVWLFIVIALYPLCKWFSEYKKTHKQWWLSYL
ncbi:MAG TPA: heparan-alpha-glucosaminide N-acetyltransferase domain-containing protein [Flavisolibacter sp.]|nr:heparan-alpha-glucosaminide N-acetyltransferase domain-containing protein [Flavisolibacter sp.]